MNVPMHNSWHSNGNLIITGEYFVLTGSKALAVPLKFGQSMLVKQVENNLKVIQWYTNEQRKSWFSTEFSSEDLSIISSTDEGIASSLQKILKTARTIQPDFISGARSYIITCSTDFKLTWGWGSSSTLISNLASWAGIDPFKLNSMVSPGSGYDIAASMSDTPLFYRTLNGNREISKAPFNPVFRNSIWFLYLGRKQDTNASIGLYSESVKKMSSQIPVISNLTELIAIEEDMDEFMRLAAEHERIISASIKMPAIKDEFFSDFNGEVKSLGAWGGDFAMAVSPMNGSAVRKYFRNKGLETLFRFDEIVRT